MNVKRLIKSFLSKSLIRRGCFKIYKFIELAKKIIAEEKRDELISKFKDVGYGVRLNGFNWYVSSPNRLIIGNNVHIGDDAYLKTEGGLVIGDNTHISRRLTVYTVNHNYKGSRLPYDDTLLKASVYIGKNVWIGMNVSITPGVKIGEGAIIGMGSIITRDIEPFEIVGLPKVRTLKERDYEHYERLNKKNLYGGKNGEVIDVNRFYSSYVEIPDNKICFVLGTGRCGSKSIANNLNKHKDIYAKHEDIKQFIRLSTEYAHGEKNVREVKNEVLSIFESKTLKNYQNELILHSDQRLWNMVPILKELFPKAKFIHLIRDGRDTVRSMYARNWFVDNELEINKHEWAEYRLNGYLAGDVDEEKWKNWGAFERCCWYWSYINESISKELLTQQKSYLIKLENIDDNLSDFLEFLDVDKHNFNFDKYNAVKKSNLKKYQFQWTEKEEEKFQKIAGETQLKFYSS